MALAALYRPPALVVFLRSLVPDLPAALQRAGPRGALGITTYLFQTLLGRGELTYYVPLAAAVLLVALVSDYNGSWWADLERPPAPVRKPSPWPRRSHPEPRRSRDHAGHGFASWPSFPWCVPESPWSCSWGSSSTRSRSFGAGPPGCGVRLGALVAEPGDPPSRPRSPRPRRRFGPCGPPP